MSTANSKQTSSRIASLAGETLQDQTRPAPPDNLLLQRLRNESARVKPELKWKALHPGY